MHSQDGFDRSAGTVSATRSGAPCGSRASRDLRGAARSGRTRPRSAPSCHRRCQARRRTTGAPSSGSVTTVTSRRIPSTCLRVPERIGVVVARHEQHGARRQAARAAPSPALAACSLPARLRRFTRRPVESDRKRRDARRRATSGAACAARAQRRPCPPICPTPRSRARRSSRGPSPRAAQSSGTKLHANDAPGLQVEVDDHTERSAREQQQPPRFHVATIAFAMPARTADRQAPRTRASRATRADRWNDRRPQRERRIASRRTRTSWRAAARAAPVAATVPARRTAGAPRRTRAARRVADSPWLIARIVSRLATSRMRSAVNAMSATPATQSRGATRSTSRATSRAIRRRRAITSSRRQPENDSAAHADRDIRRRRRGTIAGAPVDPRRSSRACDVRRE